MKIRLCEMCGQYPCECDLRQRSFWGGQETAEEEERKMIEVEPDRFKFTPEQQEMADDWMGEQCEQSL